MTSLLLKELKRFLDCGYYLISVFRLCAFFRNFHLVKEYHLPFIADFGLRKVVLRAKTRFAIIEHYQNKFKKMDCFVIPVGQKVVSLSQAKFER